MSNEDRHSRFREGVRENARAQTATSNVISMPSARNKQKEHFDADKSTCLLREMCRGLLTSAEYVQRVLSIWRSDLLDVKPAQIMCGWAMEFYNKYNKAPGANIEAWFEERREQLDYDTAEQIELVLKSLSDGHQRCELIDVDYLVDRTALYFRHAALSRHIKEVSTRLERGEITQAEAEVRRFEPPQSQMWPAPLNLARLADIDPPRRRWLVEDWLPAGVATLFGGHGSTGKSQIALELAGHGQ